MVLVALFKISVNWGGPVCPKPIWCTRKWCELPLAAFCSKASSVTVPSALLQRGGGNKFLLNGGQNLQSSSNPTEVSRASLPQFHYQQSPLGFCHPKQVCWSRAASVSNFGRLFIPVHLPVHILPFRSSLLMLFWSCTAQCSRQTAQTAPLKIFKASRPYVQARTQLQLLPLQMLSELPWSHWLTWNQLSAQMTHLATKNLCVEIVIKNPILIKPWYWSCHSYFLL